MNIALYCMGGCDISNDSNNTFHFIDPYHAPNPHWEAKVVSTHSQSRVVWHVLETARAFLSRRVERALPYATDRTLDILWRSYSNPLGGLTTMMYQQHDWPSVLKWVLLAILILSSSFCRLQGLAFIYTDI